MAIEYQLYLKNKEGNAHNFQAKTNGRIPEETIEFNLPYQDFVNLAERPCIGGDNYATYHMKQIEPLFNHRTYRVTNIKDFANFKENNLETITIVTAIEKEN